MSRRTCRGGNGFIGRSRGPVRPVSAESTRFHTELSVDLLRSLAVESVKISPIVAYENDLNFLLQTNKKLTT
jgi:hypothetical protein